MHLPVWHGDEFRRGQPLRIRENAFHGASQLHRYFIDPSTTRRAALWWRADRPSRPAIFEYRARSHAGGNRFRGGRTRVAGRARTMATLPDGVAGRRGIRDLLVVEPGAAAGTDPGEAVGERQLRRADRGAGGNGPPRRPGPI